MKDAPVMFAGLSAILLASVLLPPPGADGTLLHVPAFCPFYLLTGLPCPGCGLTRAFVCIGHGQWAESLHWHPLGIIIYAVCALWWASLAWGVISKRLVRTFTLPPAVNWSALAVVLVTGAGRIAYLLVHHVRWQP